MQPVAMLGSLGIVLICALAAYGWGLSVRRLCGAGPQGWAITAVLGLAAWLFIGGVVNALGVASAALLDLLLGGGVLACLLQVAVARRQGGRAARADIRSIATALPYAIPAAALVFLLATVMPTRLFNPFDDLHTYFARPVRLLQTGTMTGNDFDILGIDSLGAQAWLQAPIVAHFGLGYLNGADAIFCFTLGGLLLAELGRRLNGGRLIPFLAVGAYVAIHPQIVNVSAVYSGALMVLGIVFFSIALLEEAAAAAPTRRVMGAAVPAALLTAGLLALKLTFATFAAVFWLSLLALLAATAPLRRTLIAAAALLITGAIAIAPWIAPYLPRYLQALDRPALPGDDLIGLASPAGHLGELVTNKGLWAARVPDYLLLALLLACAAAMSAWRIRRAGEVGSRMACTAAVALGSGAVFTFVFNAWLFEAETAVRYSAPVLIGALPAAALLLGRRDPHAPAGRAPGRRTAVALALVLVIAVFLAPLLERARTAAARHTLVTFPVPADFERFMAGALGAPAREWTLRSQAATAERAPILAWTSVPFHFDFRRNPIIAVSEPGLLNPWLRLPAGSSPEAWRQYLAGQGIRYVFLELSGPGVLPDSEFESYIASGYPRYRRIGTANLAARRGLVALAEQSRVIRRTPGMVLYEISADES